MPENWEQYIPPIKGTLPGGAPLRRTEFSGQGQWGIAFLGVYPAATKVQKITVGNDRLNLPTEVERESFSPDSASGREFEIHYLTPLGLDRHKAMVTDLLPYYLANTAASGKDGRSMADNILAFEREQGILSGIESRPTSDVLVRLASEMKGNEERVRDYFERFRPKLLFTLGTETAAFVRGMSFAEAKRTQDSLFYSTPVPITFLGLELMVIHLVHPHLFIKQNTEWMDRHKRWCELQGSSIVSSVAGFA